MPESLDALKQVAPGLIRKMKPQEVSNTLYGYASLSRTATDDTRDTAMSKVPLAELEEAIERVAPDMNSQNVANTVWAYGTLGVPPSPQVIHELEAALRGVVMEMNPQHLANIIWAYSKFGLRPIPETLDALKQVAPGLIRKMSPQCVEHLTEIIMMTKWFYSTRLETRNKECNICESSRVLNMLEK